MVNKVNDSIEENNAFITRIRDIVTSEVNRGGLDTSSLSVMGISPANEKANKILNPPRRQYNNYSQSNDQQQSSSNYQRLMKIPLFKRRLKSRKLI